VVQAGERLNLADSDIPDASMILASCAAEFPEAAADLALSALAAETLPALLRGEDVAPPRSRILARHDSASLRLKPAVDALTACLSAVAARIGADYPRHLHVVLAEQDGEAVMAALTDPVASGLMSGALAGRLRLSIAAADSHAAERLSRAMPAAGQWKSSTSPSRRRPQPTCCCFARRLKGGWLRRKLRRWRGSCARAVCGLPPSLRWMRWSPSNVAPRLLMRGRKRA
jgi:hypothetical protein